MEAEPMRVLQFAKRSVLAVGLVSLTLAGCSGNSSSDAPYNPNGTSTDLEAMNSTFASPTFASFSTFSLMFDAALGGSPIVSSSAMAIDIRGNGGHSVRVAAARAARRLGAMLIKKDKPGGLSAAMMAIPTAVAGKTFIYDVSTSTYIASDLSGAPANGVRFLLYAVDPVTYLPADPLNETGYVDITDLSSGTTQAARIQVVSGSTTYIDYTVSYSSGATSGRVTVLGSVTDGIGHTANINLRSTITVSAGLTLTYSLTMPSREVAINLTVSVSDVTLPDSPINVNLTMRGPNGTITMTGQFAETSGTINVRINGDAFATITTDGTTTTIARTDGTPMSDEDYVALNGVFQVQSSAFTSFDQMLAPVGAFFDQPA
jgi:hypothetical protein